jgi:hypothetical protein
MNKFLFKLIIKFLSIKELNMNCLLFKVINISFDCKTLKIIYFYAMINDCLILKLIYFLLFLSSLNKCSFYTIGSHYEIQNWDHFSHNMAINSDLCSTNR